MEAREIEWTARPPVLPRTARALLSAGVVALILGLALIGIAESRALRSLGNVAALAGLFLLRRRSPELRIYRLTPFGASVGKGFPGPAEVEWKDVARIEMIPDEVRLHPDSGRRPLTLRLPEDAGLRARIELSILGLAGRRSPAEVVYDDPHGEGRDGRLEAPA